MKDAQRHALRVKPIDIQVSEWSCTLEREADGALTMRLGLGYAKGMRKQSADALVASRQQDGPFRSPDDLGLRVPSLNRKELTLLARIGALNWLYGVTHRRMHPGKSSGPENPKVPSCGNRAIDCANVTKLSRFNG